MIDEIVKDDQNLDLLQGVRGGDPRAQRRWGQLCRRLLSNSWDLWKLTSYVWHSIIRQSSAMTTNIFPRNIASWRACGWCSGKIALLILLMSSSKQSVNICDQDNLVQGWNIFPILLSQPFPTAKLSCEAAWLHPLHHQQNHCHLSCETVHITTLFFSFVILTTETCSTESNTFFTIV